MTTRKTTRKSSQSSKTVDVDAIEVQDLQELPQEKSSQIYRVDPATALQEGFAHAANIGQGTELLLRGVIGFFVLLKSLSGGSGRSG